MKHMRSIIGCIAATLACSAIVINSQTPGRPGNAPTPAEIQAQTTAAQTMMHSYLNEIGYAMLANRAQTVAAVKTKAEADRRKAEVRKKILELVGGLPKTSGPVAVKQFGIV